MKCKVTETKKREELIKCSKRMKKGVSWILLAKRALNGSLLVTGDLKVCFHWPNYRTEAVQMEMLEWLLDGLCH